MIGVVLTAVFFIVLDVVAVQLRKRRLDALVTQAQEATEEALRARAEADTYWEVLEQLEARDARVNLEPLRLAYARERIPDVEDRH